MAVLVTLYEYKSSFSMDRSPVRDGYPAYSIQEVDISNYQLMAYFPNTALIIVPHDHTHLNPTPAPNPLIAFGHERSHEFPSAGIAEGEC